MVVFRRDAAQAFVEVWRTRVDPASPFVNRAAPPPQALIEVERHADSERAVDLLLLGDGYTAAQCATKFRADAARMANALFAREPFREHRRDFNVWGICAPAAEAGVARPSADIHRRTPVGATYDIFGSERYVLTYQNRAFRDVAAWAPYEFVTILVNSATYGGGGLYNVFSTAAVDSAWADYLFVHEFAHHFAALADEYYTSPVAYTTPATVVEPWEPNVTARLPGDASQVGRPGHPRDSGADAVAQGAVRGLPADRRRPSGPGCGPSAGPRPRWTRSSARNSPSRPAPSKPAPAWSARSRGPTTTPGPTTGPRSTA